MRRPAIALLVLSLFGLGLICIGIALINGPAAVIFAGVACLFASLYYIPAGLKKPKP